MTERNDRAPGYYWVDWNESADPELTLTSRGRLLASGTAKFGG